MASWRRALALQAMTCCDPVDSRVVLAHGLWSTRADGLLAPGGQATDAGASRRVLQAV